MDAVTFKRDKETANKIRFALQDGEVTGTIYLSKEQAGEKQELAVAVTLQ